MPVEPEVAVSYDELQSLPALFRAGSGGPGPGTRWQALRALLQATEVALLNLEELAAEATVRLRQGRGAEAVRSLEWMVGFGRAWSELAWLVRDLAPVDEDGGGHLLAVTASPSWHRLTLAEKELALELKPLADHPEPCEWKRRLLRYVMLQRIGVEYTCVGGAPSAYEDFVRPDAIREAVREKRLPGENLFTPFRAAHQMPELLARAANDHIGRAVEEIEGGRADRALPLLGRADRLLDAVVRLTDLLVDRLTTDEYHAIRKALGRTSGSHSVGLHYDLMRDLYPALARASQHRDEEIGLLARTIGLHIDRWRLAHVDLPRTNLGGAGTGTRSLTGSPDALRTVARMRETGRERDPYAHTGRTFCATDWDSDVPPLAEIERRLLGGIAGHTQERFQDVQERTGRYAGPSGFAPPPKRCPARPT
ncbi:hypothetical protein [Streptomyces minutiscleroticus]|uniref:Uncharacterized protein n=1 Tax=Streptomyces minutiscleroticus TaxID=68238 RepID=A0A918NWH6_9ACTN|nr:hypothetical protein [Streptomyces minutiscleroticus]GGY02182.1 hypothetical protein GCM10010358_65150 [Streptomyces minutiscleroticus]